MQKHGPLSHIYALLMWSTVQRHKRDSKKKTRSPPARAEPARALLPTRFPTHSLPYLLYPTLNSYGVTGAVSCCDKLPNVLDESRRLEIYYEKILQCR